MVSRFLARFKYAWLGALLLAASGVASAQSVSFSFNMYQGNTLIGTVQGPTNTIQYSCKPYSNQAAVSYTVTLYTFEAWIMNSNAPYQGGGAFTAQAAYVSGTNGVAGCPSTGWTTGVPYTLPFTGGCAVNSQGQCTNAWQGHGVTFNGTQATYY